MILFDFPEERSTPFKIYIPPDLLKQVKQLHHRRLKAELHRRTFDKLLKKLSQTDIFGKEHVEDYLYIIWGQTYIIWGQTTVSV
jgi:hypothetical protein